MAGQKIYNQLIQSTSKSPVIVTGTLTCDTGASTVTVAKGTMVTATMDGANVTIKFPEKFHHAVFLSLQAVDTNASGYRALLTKDYDGTTGTCTYELVDNTATPLSSPVLKFYLCAIFPLSM